MTLYPDSSALVKLFIREIGSDVMIALRETERFTAIELGYVEVRAALAAAVRSGRLTSDRYRTVLNLFDRFWSEVTVVEVTSHLVAQAADFAETHALRAYDAMHLTALTAAGEPDEITFLCWDARLRTSAQRLGYPTIPN